MDCHQKVIEGCAGSLCQVEGVGLFLSLALFALKRQLHFFEAAFLLLDLQTIQHSLECGPQLGKVLLRRDEDQIE